jgi:thiol-disulfide isomerase/thioredoxin
MEFGMARNGCRFLSLRSLVLGLGVMLFGSCAGAGTPGEVPVGGLLPEAQLNALVGSAGKLSSFRGKPLLINVWASWCGPCREEMGSIERLSRRYGGKAFNVVGISTDDDQAAAARFVKVSGVSFPNFIDRNLVLENMLGANRLPLTVLVDEDGRVIKKVAGSRAWDSAEAINLISQAFRLKAQ